MKEKVNIKMKIWKLLIPLLISTNLIIGVPVLNKEIITNHQTWEMEKRGDLNTVNKTIVNKYINEFKNVNLKDFNFIFFSKSSNFYVCGVQDGILKSNNITSDQRIKLINKFETDLNNIKFEIYYDNRYLSSVGLGYCPDFNLYLNDLIEFKIEYIKRFIFGLTFNTYDWSEANDDFNNDLNNDEKKVVINDAKKLSYEFLNKVKRSAKKFNREPQPDIGKNS